MLSSLFNNFTLTWDLGIIAFLFFAIFFYGLSLGRRKLVLLLASSYFSFVLVKTAPYWQDFANNMSDSQKAFAETAFFAGIVLVLFYLFSGSVLKSSFRMLKKEESPWWHVLLLSFVSVGFLISSALAFFPSLYYNSLSTITREIFILNYAQFWWAVSGVAVLVILRRKKKE